MFLLSGERFKKKKKITALTYKHIELTTKLNRKTTTATSFAFMASVGNACMKATCAAR